MDPSSLAPLAAQEAALHRITVIVHSLWAARYLSGAGLVALIYDHFLTIKDEINLIWRTKSWGPIKWAFIYNRYVGEVSLILAAHVQAGFAGSLDDTACSMYQYRTCSCRGSIMGVFIVGVISMAFSSFVMVVQMYSLWDRNRKAMYVLVAGFGICYTATVVFAALTLNEVRKTIIYIPIADMKTCGLTKKPEALIGVWAGMAAFDVFLFLLTLINTMDRPHRQHVGVLTALYRDGVIFFTALLSLRILNLVLSIIAETSQILIASFFSWAMVSITLSRLILRIEALKNNRQSLHIWDATPGIIEMQTRIDVDLK
ncbi:hypothetical protein K474DRAFT_1711846 [Panus rudis PR-1116 ss-1]|nr:hypothetical protein K474DRAFT_1711846 [Panus rudis PR-1116 ss-1]